VNRRDETRETEAPNCDGGSQERANCRLQASEVCRGWAEIAEFGDGSQACDGMKRRDETRETEAPSCDGESQEKDNVELEASNVW
jgi:hypothetical protein